MSWFKSCEHEVDMTNLELPICVKCKKEIPRFVSNGTIFSLTTPRFWLNPILEKWQSKKQAKAIIAMFRRK